MIRAPIRSARWLVAATWIVGATLASGNAFAQADAGPAPPADAGPSKPAGPRTFAVDAHRSLFVLQVFKEGAAATLAHDHTIHATEIAGSVTADLATPDQASVTVTVQTKSLVNDDPQVRKQFGLDPTVPEKDKKAVEETMKSDAQLDVEKFPTMSFTSSSVEKNGDKLTLVGDFTLHGVTKRVKMPITVKIVDNTLLGDAKMRFLQSDYGIKPYSALFGAVKNKDEVVLNVHLVAVSP